MANQKKEDGSHTTVTQRRAVTDISLMSFPVIQPDTVGLLGGLLFYIIFFA